MWPLISLPLQMVERSLRAQPDSVANHVKARRSLIERSVTWLATESGWARSKRSTISSGKLCGGFIIIGQFCPCGRLIDWVRLNVPPNTHIIGHIGDGFFTGKWPNQQCQSTEEGMLPEISPDKHAKYINLRLGLGCCSVTVGRNRARVGKLFSRHSNRSLGVCLGEHPEGEMTGTRRWRQTDRSLFVDVLSIDFRDLRHCHATLSAAFPCPRIRAA